MRPEGLVYGSYHVRLSKKDLRHLKRASARPATHSLKVSTSCPAYVGRCVINSRGLLVRKSIRKLRTAVKAGDLDVTKNHKLHEWSFSQKCRWWDCHGPVSSGEESGDEYEQPSSDQWSDGVESEDGHEQASSDSDGAEEYYPPDDESSRSPVVSKYKYSINLKSRIPIAYGELRAGNWLLAAKNWSEAVIRYSQCINLAVYEPDNNSDIEVYDIWDWNRRFERILSFAYSNRAEARLRLEDYQNALIDSDRALEFPWYYGQNRATDIFVLKGKAAHGLHLFEKAYEAFEKARERRPEDQAILENLDAITEPFVQSKYDLSEFFLKGCKGQVPFCDDFRGPVDVDDRYWRTNSTSVLARLHATRNVKAGQLLLVSNPLAVVVKDVDWEKNLIAEVTDQIRTSKRKMAQLLSLGHFSRQYWYVRSLKNLLFFESEDSPSDHATSARIYLEHDMDRAGRLVEEEAICRDDHTLWAKPCDKNESEVVGLWVIPKFASHSCAPNVFLTWIGDAVFLRASKDLQKGETLTISFLQEKHLFVGSVFRDGELFSSRPFESWMKRRCYCDRCLFERKLQAPVATLARISKVIPKLVVAAKAESLQEGQTVWRATKKLANVADEVEQTVIQTHKELEPRQSGWIRSYFLDAYIAKLQLAMYEGDSQSKIQLLRLVVYSIVSVYITPRALKLAANLLWEVEKMYSKDDNSYVLTLNRVLGIYRIAFGQEPDSVLHKLVKVNQLKDLKEYLLHYNAE